MVGKICEKPINNFKMVPSSFQNFWKSFRVYLAKEENKGKINAKRKQ
jgi:hypothetical protein